MKFVFLEEILTIFSKSNTNHIIFLTEQLLLKFKLIKFCIITIYQAERESALLSERMNRGRAEAEIIQCNRKLLTYIDRAFEENDFFLNGLFTEETQNLRRVFV